MTNKFNHHYSRNIFRQQADTNTVQQPPASVPVEAPRRTESALLAGKTRLIPLAVECLDTLRNPARLPADPGQRLTTAGSMQKHIPQHGRGYLPHNGEGVLRERHGLNTSVTSCLERQLASAQAYSPTQELVTRGARIDPGQQPSSREHVERPLRGVRQDKDRNSCDRVASPQPAAVNKFTRSQATSRNSARSKNDSADKSSRTVPVQVWVSPLVKAELSRIASQDGLSLSSAGAAFLTRGIQQNVDMQYGALINPVIEQAIARQMAGIATRLTWLLVRIAFDAGQTRSLVTNILGRQQGVTQPLLKTILDGSGRSAKANVMRRTPQITELISSVEQWMTEDNRGVSGQKPHD